MESVVEGVIVEWRKAVGDQIAADEILVEVSTDKVDIEVPSPRSGTVAEILVQPGDSFASRPRSPSSRRARSTTGAPTPSAPAAPATPAPASAAGDPLAANATPPARRAAAEAGVDLATVTGSGPGGKIRRDDVRLERRHRPPGPSPADERIQLKGPASVLADYMDASREIPTATTFRTLNVAALDERRASFNAALKGAAAPRSSPTPTSSHGRS